MRVTGSVSRVPCTIFMEDGLLVNRSMLLSWVEKQLCGESPEAKLCYALTESPLPHWRLKTKRSKGRMERSGRRQSWLQPKFWSPRCSLNVCL